MLKINPRSSAIQLANYSSPVHIFRYSPRKNGLCSVRQFVQVGPGTFQMFTPAVKPLALKGAAESFRIAYPTIIRKTIGKQFGDPARDEEIGIEIRVIPYRTRRRSRKAASRT